MTQITNLDNDKLYCLLHLLLLNLLVFISVKANAAPAKDISQDNLANCLQSNLPLVRSPLKPLFDLPEQGDLNYTLILSAKIKKLTSQPVTFQSKLALAQALWRKSLIYNDTKLADQALDVISHDLDSHSSDELLLLRAQINMTLHRFAQAIEDLNQVVEQNSQVDNLRLQISRLTGIKENLPLQSVDRYSFANMQMLVDKHIGWGDLEQARWLLEQMMEMIDGHDPLLVLSIYRLEARLAETQGYPELALDWLKQAVKLLPEHVETLKALAGLYQQQGEFELAIACLNYGAERSDDPHLIAMLADSYAFSYQHKQAKQIRDRAIVEFQRILAEFPLVYAGQAADFLAEQAVDNRMLQQAAKWANVDAKNRPLSEQWIRIANISLQLNKFETAKAALRLVKTREDLTERQKRQIKDILQRMNG